MNQGETWCDDHLKKFLKDVHGWYHDNTNNFQDDFDRAIKNVQDCPPDLTGEQKERVWKDWQNATIHTLTDFLSEWCRWGWTQGVHDGLQYIEKFSWINYNNKAGTDFMVAGQGAVMLAEFTRLQGEQMDDERSVNLVRQWIEELGPKTMAAFKKGDWSTYNKFFIRELKPGVRPIADPLDPSVVVAPTDCVINMIVDELTDGALIPVKTVAMNVSQLLHGSTYATRFTRDKDGNQGGGTAVSCILLPDTYHRYHAPVGGEVVEAHDDLPGVYYGMQNFPELVNNGNVGYGYDYNAFTDFRRGYVIFKTPYVNHLGEPDGEGYVALVAVGLNSIGSVKFLDKFRNVTDDRPVAVDKGEEIGCFQYGGSMNILLFEKGRFPALQLLMGQRIGLLEGPERSEKYFGRSYRAHASRTSAL
ncbi:phosphatidylserine decarboxylase [Streptomyces sp. NPDC006638]|uniref:phosphatidylserine decarboxylase n=1 Tax=Streptomyces sp. NPDC006638 TaxID=3157183 RepID=UPI0033B30BBD